MHELACAFDEVAPFLGFCGIFASFYAVDLFFLYLEVRDTAIWIAFADAIGVRRAEVYNSISRA
jgi:hypothetical protein